MFNQLSKPFEGLTPSLATSLKWAAVAAVPAVALYCCMPRGPADDYRTDFDGFLRAQEEMGSTGHTAKVKKVKKLSRVSGPIDGFYKDQGEDDDEITPLDSLLKLAGMDQFVTKLPNSSAAASALSGPSAEHVRVVVLYGTEFGFSKEIAEKLCCQLKEAKTYW